MFYDKNEQHRILAMDIEEYLRPIYQSEAQFVLALLSKHYPKKIWTKIESDSFKDRLKTGEVVPIWFSDTPTSLFDETQRVGGITLDVTLPIALEVEQIVGVLLRKLGDVRQTNESPQLTLPT